MPLGMDVGLGPGDFVLDGDAAPKSAQPPPNFGPSLLRPNGWMDESVDFTDYLKSNVIRLLWSPYGIGQTIIFMAVLCNRAGHYIFALWFLSSSSSFYVFFVA